MKTGNKNDSNESKTIRLGTLARAVMTLQIVDRRIEQVIRNGKNKHDDDVYITRLFPKEIILINVFRHSSYTKYGK